MYLKILIFSFTKEVKHYLLSEKYSTLTTALFIIIFRAVWFSFLFYFFFKSNMTLNSSLERIRKPFGIFTSRLRITCCCCCCCREIMGWRMGLIPLNRHFVLKIAVEKILETLLPTTVKISAQFSLCTNLHHASSRN